MKTYVKVLIGAVLIGGILAFIFYKDIKNDVMAISNNTDLVNVFQLGVYKNIKNANKKQNEYSESIVIKKDDYYRVIASVCYSNDTCDILKKYFDSLGIKYYLKKYKISNNFIKELKYYETVINNGSISAIDGINKKINNLFITYLN